MLTCLTVKQFALIEQLHLELGAGMTVFTGETGAGKSMLGDALGAAFGARASAEWVRHGADKAEVTAIWEGADVRLDALLEAADIDVDDELILRRVVTAEGRSRAYINGMPVPLKTLQQIGKQCLDMHGQHEHQALMQDTVQQQLLDARVSEPMLRDVKTAYSEWQQLQSRLKSLHSERGETEQQAVWMREELSRLEVLEINEELADTLQSEVDAGRHHAQIQQAAGDALMLLDEAEPSVRDLIAKAGHAMAAVEDFHAGLHSSREMIDQMDALLGEVTPELRSVMDESFDEAGWDEASLLQALNQAADQYTDLAATLNTERQAQGEKLVSQLRPFLDKLALGGMQVRFDVRPAQDESGWHVDGWDTIGIRMMSNPGEPWRVD